MKPANRCPECGGVASHIVTDIVGNNYYQCNTGLTSLREDTVKDDWTEEKRIIRTGGIISCDTIIDSKGKLVTGTIAYDTGGKTETLAVTNGKERR